MTIQITNEELARWLRDRNAGLSRIDPSVAAPKTITLPPLLPDISVFGKSLALHHFKKAKKRPFCMWLDAYEHAIQATRNGVDPIPIIAKKAGLGVETARAMLSGYRAHPIDEMNAIAQFMAYGAGLMYTRSGWYKDGLFYRDNQAIMGVKDVIYSPFSENLPIRLSFNALAMPRSNVEHPVPREMYNVFRLFDGDYTATRLLSYFTITVRGIDGLVSEIGKWFDTSELPPTDETERKHAEQMIGATLDKLKDILIMSERPIVEAYRLMVPRWMKTTEFRQVFGNPATQGGRPRPATLDRLLLWVDSQRNIIDKFTG